MFNFAAADNSQKRTISFGSSTNIPPATRTAPAATSNLFGASNNALSLNSNTNTNANTNTSAASTGGLFGASSSSGGLFGSTAPNTNASANATGGLFGSSNTQNPATSSNLFSSNSATGGSSSLFGSSTASQPRQAGVFQLGSANNTATTGVSTGLFGSAAPATNPANASTARSLFGAAGTTNSGTNNNGGLFSSNANANATSNTNAFPGFNNNLTNATNSANKGLFGLTPSDANSQLLAGNKPALTIQHSTKFSELPEQTKQIFKEIDQFKKKQIDIGVILRPIETKNQIDQVQKQILLVEQNLASIKLGLENDKKVIETTNDKINAYLRDADRLISIVSQAIDDVAWETSGLTPLQMAQRQRLMARQGMGIGAGAAEWASGSGGAGADSGTNSLASTIQLQREYLSVSKPADPIEASRRVQVVLMNSNSTTEYFWSWLTKTEARLAEIQQTIDALSKYVTPILERQIADSAGGGSAGSGANHSTNYSKAISDVVRNQTESLVRMAQKIASIEDRLTALKQMPKKSNFMD